MWSKIIQLYKYFFLHSASLYFSSLLAKHMKMQHILLISQRHYEYVLLCATTVLHCECFFFFYAGKHVTTEIIYYGRIILAGRGLFSGSDMVWVYSNQQQRIVWLPSRVSDIFPNHKTCIFLIAHPCRRWKYEQCNNITGALGGSIGCFHAVQKVKCVF